jgi:hypothetical protein
MLGFQAVCPIMPSLTEPRDRSQFSAATPQSRDSHVRNHSPDPCLRSFKAGDFRPALMGRRERILSQVLLRRFASSEQCRKSHQAPVLTRKEHGKVLRAHPRAGRRSNPLACHLRNSPEHNEKV